MKNRHLKKWVISILLIITVFTTVACTGSTHSQVSNPEKNEGDKNKIIFNEKEKEMFIENTANFSIELFKNSIEAEENSLISPMSVMTALLMTANGASNDTLVEMENSLTGDVGLKKMNKYIQAYMESIKDDEVMKLANSIWIRDLGTIIIDEKFIETNKNFYESAVFREPFNKETVSKINKWVKENTDDMIEKIVDDISNDEIMYLINALAFNGEWENPYEKTDISHKKFTAINGEEKYVEMMNSDENLYLKGKNATGFIKPYKGEKYSFVAILPNQNININEYIESMTGEDFVKLITEAKQSTVYTVTPKFTYEYSKSMNKSLQNVGITDAFNEELADFSNMTKDTKENIFIGDVLHKTFISVDELGTKAGAVTAVMMDKTSMVVRDGYEVVLDRPFIYAIIENNTGLPVFIGTVVNVPENN